MLNVLDFLGVSTTLARRLLGVLLAHRGADVADVTVLVGRIALLSR